MSKNLGQGFHEPMGTGQTPPKFGRGSEPNSNQEKKPPIPALSYMRKTAVVLSARGYDAIAQKIGLPNDA